MAARLCLKKRFFRASANRAYYAAYQAATALLLHSRLVPRPDYGNWNHLKTITNLENTNVKRLLETYRSKSIIVRQNLGRLYALRCQADYDPAARIEGPDCRNALRLSVSVANLAKEIIGYAH